MKEKISKILRSMSQHWLKPIISLGLVAILLLNSASPLTAKALAADADPLSYYKQVEKDSMNKNVDALTKAYTDYLANYGKAATQKIGIASTLQTTIDSSIMDKTEFKGIKSIKADMISMINGTNTKTNMKISCNDQELTSLDVYTLKDAYYYLIPDLSKAYLKLDAKSFGDSTSATVVQNGAENFMKEPVSADVLNQLLKKYGTLFIDNVKNVSKNENVDVTIDGVSSAYTRLDVTMNEKELLNMSTLLLTAIKNDTDLQNICTKYGICTQKEYNKEITKDLADNAKELKALKKKKSNGKNVLKMSLYVDSQGEITGRSVKISGSKEDSFDMGYKTSKSGLKMGMEAWIKSGSDSLKLTGSAAAGLSGFSGDMKLSYKDASSKTNGSVNLDFKDMKYVKNDTTAYATGECTLTGTDFKGMSFHMKLSGDFTKQDIVLDILQNSKSMAVVSLSVKSIPYVDFTLPSSSDTIYDIGTQLEDYLKTANVKGYLEGIKQKSDIPIIDSMIDEMLLEYKNSSPAK